MPRKPSAATGEITKGYYYCIRHRGKNGETILGCVVGVVKEGGEKVVILRNMLNPGGRFSTKEVNAFLYRYKRISKPQASRILAVYKKTNSKQKARELAVSMTSRWDKGGARHEPEQSEPEVRSGDVLAEKRLAEREMQFERAKKIFRAELNALLLELRDARARELDKLFQLANTTLDVIGLRPIEITEEPEQQHPRGECLLLPFQDDELCKSSGVQS